MTKKLGKTEEEIQKMVDRADSLNQAELVMAMEEVLGELHR